MSIIQTLLTTMFSSIGLFQQVQCPEQSHCSLSNCIFAHHSPSTVQAAEGLPLTPPVPSSSHDDALDQDRPRKRRRLGNDIENATERDISGSNAQKRDHLAFQQGRTGTAVLKPPFTASREISPPPLRSSKGSTSQHTPAQDRTAISLKSTKDPNLNGLTAPAKKVVEEFLNPRMIPKPPASHAVRMQLLTMVHEQMVRLNEEVWQSQDPSKSILLLNSQELILEALDEEEKVAKQSPAVYLNIVKLRITKLRKMQLAEWKEERLKQIARRTPVEVPTEAVKPLKVIETGLTTSEEIAFLSKLSARQSQLTKYGYVPTAPSDKEVAKAREGVEAAQGWEECDRCKSRFQVFAGRREEDGALTSGGQCTYHPAKPRRPISKDKADKVVKESIYACCNESVGQSSGCTAAPTHVFKISDPKRLALVMPFKETPPKLLTPGPNIAVCFDCEMGYTTMGLELIRLTATSWPNGEELLDVLVRPLGEVLDLNSRFSGVFPKDYADAIPYNSGLDTSQAPNADGKPQLRLVDSPAAARDLLFGLLTPETPLIGHALDNDLNAARIIHPSIVDSVLLYPHPRGLPIRFGLKVLMKKHLDRDIQTGGAQGHDSKEDAQAAGDLVRLKVAETWKAMKRDGWTMRDREFLPPLPNVSTAKFPFGAYAAQTKG